MKSYLLEKRSPLYKKYAFFLFNSLGNAAQPIPKRILSEMFQRGNRNHYTRMEYNFNMYVVPHIICHDCNWEEKAQVFYVTATPVLGEKLKEQFEKAGTIELDENFRIEKFQSTKFTLQRDASHTAYHKSMTDKSKIENARVQNEAFEKFVSQSNQNINAMDMTDHEMNEPTFHLGQEVMIDENDNPLRAAEGAVDDLYANNLDEELVGIDLQVEAPMEIDNAGVVHVNAGHPMVVDDNANLVEFVEGAGVDHANAGHQVVIDENENPSRAAEGAVDDLYANNLNEELVRIDLQVEAPMEINNAGIVHVNAGHPMVVDDNANLVEFVEGAGVDHANAGHQVVIDENENPSRAAEGAVDDLYANNLNEELVRIDLQVEAPMEINNAGIVHVNAGHPMVVDDNANLVEFVEGAGVDHANAGHQVVIDENDNHLRAAEGAVDDLNANIPDEVLVRINRQVVGQMEIDQAAINHASFGHPVVVNDNTNPIGVVEKAVDGMDDDDFDEELARIEREVEALRGINNAGVVHANAGHQVVVNDNIDPVGVAEGALDDMDVHPDGDPATLAMSNFYSAVKNAFEKLFNSHLTDEPERQIFERNFDKGLLCDDIAAYFCETLDRCATMRVFSDPLRKELSKIRAGRNTIIPYEAICKELQYLVFAVRNEIFDWWNGIFEELNMKK